MYESMVFYKSFYDAICGLDRELQAEIYDAVIYYGIYGEVKELSPMASSIFILIKPQIDANNRRKENGKKGAEYGKMGGRPKKENPTETPKKPQENPIETPNVKVNVKVKDNDSIGEKRKRFIPPTLEEVKGYASERGNLVDAQKFYDYYTQGGWKDAKGNAVKNWKQKMITWEKHSDKPKQNRFNDHPQNDVDLVELEKKIFAN